MEILLLITILFFTLLGILILVTLRDSKYFTSRGIPYLGNMNYRMILFNSTLADNSLYWYKKAKDQNIKIAGLKELLTPTIMITEPDLIKKILVKDFEHFVDHRPFKLSDRDYILKKFLPLANGEHWKSLRSKVSPTFSTAKIRRMFQIFNTSSKKLVSYLEKQTENCSQIDLAEGFVKFTTDVVASAAFGFDCKAFDQKEHPQFQKMGEKLKFQCKGLEILKFLMMEVFPKKLSELLGLLVFSIDSQEYFSRIVKSEIQQRKETGVKREDFIQFMIEAKEGKLNKKEAEELTDFDKDAEIKTRDLNSNKFTFDDDDITTQSVGFILAGLDVTDACLLFTAYVLALNSDVQDRLFQEISSSFEDNGGEFTYDSVNQMEYFNMVMNETLRMYSPAPFTNRACTKDYRIPGSNITIKKGEIVVIPSLGIHRDSIHFEDPDRFNPDRWSAENRSKIHPYAFIPFGHGPRSCPGMRFALCEVKIAMAHLLHNFIIEPCKKTSIPMKFESSLTLRPRDGMWITLTKRK